MKIDIGDEEFCFNRLKDGNVFQTREEAEIELKKQIDRYGKST
jgi:hypothetical protein